MSKETLSMKQANKIADDFGIAMLKIVCEVNDRNHDFYMTVKKIWQDQNACDFKTKHSRYISDALETLRKNYRIFILTLVEITNAYASAGGMNEKFSPSIDEVTIFRASSLSYTQIGADEFHPYFTQGYGMAEFATDEFGFMNPETGGQEAIDAFNELVNAISKRAQEVVDEIKKINAFGNTTIKLNLARSSGLVVSELSNALDKSLKDIQELLERTAAMYKKVGQEAVGAANIGGSSSGANSASNGGDPAESISNGSNDIILDENTINSIEGTSNTLDIDNWHELYPDPFENRYTIIGNSNSN